MGAEGAAWNLEREFPVSQARILPSLGFIQAPICPYSVKPGYCASGLKGSHANHRAPLRSARHSVGIVSVGVRTRMRCAHTDDKAIALACWGVRTASVAQPARSNSRANLSFRNFHLLASRYRQLSQQACSGAAPASASGLEILRPVPILPSCPKRGLRKFRETMQRLPAFFVQLHTGSVGCLQIRSKG